MLVFFLIQYPNLSSWLNRIHHQNISKYNIKYLNISSKYTTKIYLIFLHLNSHPLVQTIPSLTWTTGMASFLVTCCHSCHAPVDFLATARDKNRNRIMSLSNLKSIKGSYFLFLRNKKSFPNSESLHFFLRLAYFSLSSSSHRQLILILIITDLILLSQRGLPWPHFLGCPLESFS